jgi:hypothetical protein
MSAAAPTAIPLPKDHILVLRTTTRAHSSHSENHSTNAFRSYEAASKYLLGCFKEGYEAFEAWQDVDEEREDGDPDYETIEQLRARMTPEKLKDFCEKNHFGDPLFAPFSEEWGAALYELSLDLVELE